MWPWEHLALGYLLFTAFVHLVYRERPGDVSTIALALGTQAPDLVDKPLGWTFGFYSTGYGAAHSVLVAGPFLGLVLAAALHYGRPRVGLGLALGWSSHMLADVVDPLRYGHPPNVGRVFWPVVRFDGYERDLSFFERFGAYAGEFVGLALAPEYRVFLFAYLSIFAVVFVVWLFDGGPGLRGLVRLATDRRPARN